MMQIKSELAQQQALSADLTLQQLDLSGDPGASCLALHLQYITAGLLGRVIAILMMSPPSGRGRDRFW